MSSKFAKISRPQLAQGYQRQRLFSFLDTANTKTLTWISANAGAGKTMLMASYLDGRQLSSIWYRMDARDADPATFFFYLREAALQSGLPQAETIPLLTAEYVGAESVFAQNFFAQLFIDASHPYALIFDDFQDLPGDSPVSAILNRALAELPHGIRVFILSRNAPPETFVRWQANQDMAVIDAQAMQLDREETAALVSLYSETQIGEELVDIIYRETGGWAAGVILLLEHINRFGEQALTAGKASREAMFHYFAAELYENAPEDMRRFLDWTAIVPQFDIEMARKLTGIQDVDRLVRELVRKNYFIYAQDTEELAYQYHPLFCHFLREKVRRDQSPERYRQTLAVAAKILRESQQIDDAADLYIEARDWPAVADIVIHEAEKLHSHGRVLQIEQWIMAIPEEVRITVPDLNYWYGICRIGFDLYVARDAFERAEAGFQANRDTVWRCLAVAGVIETYVYEGGDFKPLDHWIDELDTLLAANAELLTPAAGARVTVALFIAYMYRRPDHPQLPALSLEVHGIVERMPNDLLRLTAGSYLLLYYIWWGDIPRGGALVKLLKPLMQSQRVSPLLQITWLAIEAHYSWSAAETTHCIETAEHAMQIAKATGVHVWDFLLFACAGWGALTSDNLKLARQYQDCMAATVQPGNLLDLGHYHHQMFSEAMHRNDVAAMQEHSSAALQLARDAGVPWAEGLMLTAYARAQAAFGDCEAAEQSLRQAEQFASRLGSDIITHAELLARVELGLPRDDEIATLRQLMTVSRRRGLANFTWWRGAAMSKIFAQALEHGIETDFALSVIKRRGLVPVSTMENIETWPWPIRIYTLGRFTVLMHDKPLTFSGKAQKRPMDLLKVLLASGGQQVSEQTISEALWPDTEGDAAHSTFNTTLSRLRKLLGDNVLLFRNGMLSLNKAVCWVDIWAVEGILGQLEKAVQKQAQVRSMDRLLQNLQNYYQGPFLRDEGQGWALSLRERLKSRVLRVIHLFVQQETDSTRMITLYEFALQIDELEEQAYQGLMRCLTKQDRNSEALALYGRCRNLMQAKFGIEPAEKTRQLAIAIQNQQKT